MPSLHIPAACALLTIIAVVATIAIVAATIIFESVLCFIEHIVANALTKAMSKCTEF